jgi:outer membrane protein assembly factor BamB
MRISSTTVRTALFVLAVILATCAGSCHHASTSNGGGGGTTVSVLEHHNSPHRDGVYVDPTLTKASASAFHIDPTFHGVVPGAIYAQLLYFASGPGGKDIVIAVTEENNVAALDAATGATVWTRSLGTPVPLSQLPCGDIDPLGITGTPVIDPASRTLFLDAMITPDNGITKKHLIFALSIDDGLTLPGWPVDVSAAVTFSGISFDSSVQNQRGALALVNGVVYVPYGGLAGDCGNYHGWLAGVPIANPAAPKAWATGSRGGGIWSPSGVSSENGAIFAATGNTFAATTWAGGEALLRFSAGPVFSNLPTDYFTPSNWQALDAGDIDIGGTGPLILDVLGATPAQLLIGLGKDGKIYLVNRDKLGGVGNQVAVAQVSTTAIINAAAAYTTSQGTYVVFKGNGINCPAGQLGNLTAVRIVPGAPPTVTTAWCVQQNGEGSPMVTTTDGHSEIIVWSVGAEGDNRLHGFDGDTGQIVYGGGGPGDVIGLVRRFHTPILAGSRIYVAADGVVMAFVR